MEEASGHSVLYGQDGNVLIFICILNSKVIMLTAGVVDLSV
jgi:hypothetical protein